MKYRELRKGKRAVRRVRFPLVNVSCPLAPAIPELEEQRQKDLEAWKREHPDDDPVEDFEVGLRVLTGDEQAQIDQGAREYAEGKGVKNAKRGDESYDLGRCMHTLLIACVDPETEDAPGGPEPFFDSIEQIATSVDLGRDGILWLAEQQEIWQDLCSNEALKLTPEQLWKLIEELAGESSLPFYERLRPGMRWLCTHSMAILLRISQTDKSPSGGLSTTSTDDEKPRPPKKRSRSTAGPSKRKPRRKAARRR